MGEEKNFIFYADWLKCINKLSDEKDKFDLYKAIAEYGVYGFEELDDASDVVKNIFSSLIKPAIDRAQSKYSEMVNYGKTHGRPKTVNDEEIVRLWREGKKAKEIAKIMKLSEAAIYHSDGWRNRKNYIDF